MVPEEDSNFLYNHLKLGYYLDLVCPVTHIVTHKQLSFYETQRP